jgi:hypothetical protein
MTLTTIEKEHIKGSFLLNILSGKRLSKIETTYAERSVSLAELLVA